MGRVKKKWAGRRRKGEILPPANPIAAAFFRNPPGPLVTIIAVALGVGFGLSAAYISSRGSDASASYAAALDLRDAPLTAADAVSTDRAAVVAHILSAGAPERLQPDLGRPKGAAKPKIILIFDDVGIDRAAFGEIMRLPGPLTLSFLPYAKDVQALVDTAKARGDEIMLHLPMEPLGVANPGPHTLKTNESAEKIFDDLSWSLAQFTGYDGVNNHMGSRFTRNEQDMKRVLALLKQRGLFFIDSLTTSKSAASKAGAAVGAEVYLRDVFLDPEPGEAIVRRQLALAERIADATGYAVVICHPREETLAIVGPWLTTAIARGFELDTASHLRAIKTASKSAPAKRARAQ